MSRLPRIDYPGRQTWIGLLITGVMFLISGFVIWFIGLALFLVGALLGISRFVHPALLQKTRIIPVDVLLGLAYGGAFLLAAMLVARSRWSHRCGMAALIAYAVYSMATLSGMNWNHKTLVDTLCFFTPLISGPLGGMLGERFFASNSNR